MSTIPCLTYVCPHCPRVYRRKREFELHKTTCGIINGDATELEKEVERRQDTMSFDQLCDVVKVLVREQAVLKGQVKKLQNQLATIRRKVTVEEYLDKGASPTITLNELACLLQFTVDDFNELLGDKLDPVLEAIVSRATPCIDDLPLRTFTGHTGTFYCKDNMKWRKMNEDDWTSLSGIVTHSLMSRLKEWTDENEHKLSDDCFSLRYNSSVQKVMSCMSKIQPKLMAFLCQRVRVSLSGITTFEFTFA